MEKLVEGGGETGQRHALGRRALEWLSSNTVIAGLWGRDSQSQPAPPSWSPLSLPSGGTTRRRSRQRCPRPTQARTPPPSWPPVDLRPGSSPSRAGNLQLASHLAAGPRLFGAWTDFLSSSSRQRRLFTKPQLEGPPRVAPSSKHLLS